MRFYQILLLMAVAFVASCNVAIATEDAVQIKKLEIDSPRELVHESHRSLRGLKKSTDLTEERAAAAPGLRQFLNRMKPAQLEKFTKFPLAEQVARIKTMYGSTVSKAYIHWLKLVQKAKRKPVRNT